MSICWKFGWFVSRITEQLLKGFCRNLDGGLLVQIWVNGPMFVTFFNIEGKGVFVLFLFISQGIMFDEEFRLNKMPGIYE